MAKIGQYFNSFIKDNVFTFLLCSITNAAELDARIIFVRLVADYFVSEYLSDFRLDKPNSNREEPKTKDVTNIF